MALLTRNTEITPTKGRCGRSLAALGGGPLADDAWLSWQALIGEGAADLPVLLRAARVAGRWQHERAAGEGRADLLSAPALFLAAALWRGLRQDALPLPLWSAPAAMLQALALRGGGAPGWTGDLLTVAVAATRQAHAELRRLLAVERRGRALAGSVTARSLSGDIGKPAAWDNTYVLLPDAHFSLASPSRVSRL